MITFTFPTEQQVQNNGSSIEEKPLPLGSNVVHY